jgi:prophage antirepressor-like protein
MTTQLIPFEFEGQPIRVVTDATGEPWFVAADIAQSLDYRMASDMTRFLDEDERGTQTVRTPSGDQEMLVINESGLYSAILKSRKPEAKRFRRWVTREVLPAIRKTGAYVGHAIGALPAPTQDRVAALILIGNAVAKVPGVKSGIAMAATLDCIQTNTGLTIEPLRRALPAANEPICSLNATQLGKLINASAKATNRRLAGLGLQLRNERDEWELTDAGQAWAEALPFSRNGHSGYQILWNPAVADQLVEVA